MGQGWERLQQGRAADPRTSHGAEVAFKSATGALCYEAGPSSTGAHPARRRPVMAIAVSDAARILEERGNLRRTRKDRSEWVIGFVSSLIGQAIPTDLAEFYRDAAAGKGPSDIRRRLRELLRRGCFQSHRPSCGLLLRPRERVQISGVRRRLLDRDLPSPFGRARHRDQRKETSGLGAHDRPGSRQMSARATDLGG